MNSYVKESMLLYFAKNISDSNKGEFKEGTLCLIIDSMQKFENNMTKALERFEKICTYVTGIMGNYKSNNLISLLREDTCMGETIGRYFGITDNGKKFIEEKISELKEKEVKKAEETIKKYYEMRRQMDSADTDNAISRLRHGCKEEY